MNQMDILEFALCLIDLATTYLFFQYILNARFSGLFPALLTAGINAVLVYFCSGFDIVYKSLIFVCLLVAGSTVLYRDKMLIRTALSMLTLYIFYIIDIIFGNICSLIFDQQFLDVFYSSFVNRLIVCLIIKIFDIIAFILIAKAFHKVELNLSSRIWGLFNVAIGVFLAITVAFIHIYSQASQNDLSALVYSIISVSFLAMSIIVIYFFTYVCSSFQQKQRLYVLQTNYSTMEEKLAVQTQNSEKLQKVRHDIKNHLMNIKTLLVSGDTHKATELLNEVMAQADDITISIDQSTGNSVLDAAISFKAAECKNREICFEYSLQALPPLHIDSVDISSVITNLLDNAIDAASKTPEPWVSLKILMHGSYLSVIVQNTFANDVVTSEKGALMSTKEASGEHGYGTQIITQIAQKYDGDFIWKSSNGVFQANVILKASEHGKRIK